MNKFFVKFVNFSSLLMLLVTFAAFFYVVIYEPRQQKRDLASMPIPGPATDAHGK